MLKMTLYVFSFLLAGIIFIVLATYNPVFTDFSKKDFEDLPLKSSSKSLEKYTRQIVEGGQFRNYTNLTVLNNVAKIIHNHFSSRCDKSYFQKFEAEDNEYKNVICRFDFNKKETIIIGAHYDVAFEQDGADDNATGVAGIMEISDLIKKIKTNNNQFDLPYNVELVAYTLEEPPFFRSNEMGSYFHAKSLEERKDEEFLFMISLEMLGYYSDEEKSQDYPISILKYLYPTTGNFILIVSDFQSLFRVRKLKKLMKQTTALPTYSINALRMIPGIDFSDHMSYWKLGHKALMITDTAFYRNKNYHRKGDTIEKLNFEKMSYVINGVMNIVLNYR